MNMVKIVITIWNFDRHDYVIKSHDKKMNTATEIFEFEVPQKPFKSFPGSFS